MINGDLSEAKQGSALLEDVDEATFVRFIRWTYSKDYPSPDPTTVDLGDKEGAFVSETAGVIDVIDDIIEVRESDETWGPCGRPSKKDKKKKEKTPVPKSTLKDSFIESCSDVGRRGRWKAMTMPSCRDNKGPHEDYTEVFLGHARMYVFAEKYDIAYLQELSLQKLYHTLAIYTLYPERVGDITSLLKYVYANTAETKDGLEDIRTLLAHYIGTEMGTLIRDGENKDLMMENGEMLGDFLNMFTLTVS